MSYFDRAFDIIVSPAVEGGYTPGKDDPGGETKYGISKRRYPNEDIKNLTMDRARFLYQRDYWNINGCEAMTWEQALLVFDAAINGGYPKRWHDMYAGYPAKEFIINFQAEHNMYLASLRNWPENARGWSRRLVRLALLAEKQPSV